MTGYGLATTDLAGAKYSVEIKSLNSKFLELNLKFPRAISDKELLLRNICSKDIERGKVSVSITIDRVDGENAAAQINASVLSSYYRQLKSINDGLGANSTNLLQLAMTLPEVINYKEENINEEEWIHVNKVFIQALEQFNTFRTTEGLALKADLDLRIANILDFFSSVEELEPTRIIAIRERFSQFLEEAVSKVNIDQNRFEQELIYYIDKIDITEEKTRLRSHCDYFLKTLASNEANGKKLGFISQEIGREINTMGAKANNAQMQQFVVGMKEELEKIKEQLLNVL
ncbi:YicC/YloC family endoribonuclease [Pedobacter sp. UYEF25]